MKLLRIIPFLIVPLAFFIVSPLEALAHPGRTDSSGCHTCKTNCPNWGLSYGEYHCHNAKALPQPEEAIRSHYGENGTGTTEPWPEYKSPSTFSSTPTNNSSFAANSNLKKGMSGTEVKKLQIKLASDPLIYPEGLITGYYGPATERAVMRFQKKYGLEQVGFVGPKTRALLNIQ